MQSTEKSNKKNNFYFGKPALMSEMSDWGDETSSLFSFLLC